MARLPKKEWLKNAVFYQIYPTSFFDSNDDGIGDINGIIQKLDYVQNLGCDGIWLNPCFESAFRDGGYDVIDYYKVDSRFGPTTIWLGCLRPRIKKVSKSYWIWW
ncbi:MAG TPA: hypothetical protein GX745_05580 [Clostridiales bacterium]|nr:hypothetical protein [Clostridiales bacterium]